MGIATSDRRALGFEPRTLTSRSSAHLALIRGLAALAVMSGHLRAIFFSDYGHVTSSSPLLRAFYFLTGFGHQAVMVFFVLSGFLISSAVFRRRASGDWSWMEFAIDRSSRLYVVLVPGLLFTLLWDTIGHSLAAPLYTHPLVAFGQLTAAGNTTPPIFLGNLLFVQTILCPTFGSNGPLWSLANELWYYVLFPVVLFAAIAWAQLHLRTAIVLTLIGVLIVAFVGSTILIGFPIWLAGCGVVLGYAKAKTLRKRWQVAQLGFSFFVLLACLFAARTGYASVLGNDLTVGISFALFLYCILAASQEQPSRSYSRLAHGLAGFSFSLYVLHFPFLLVLRAWITPSQRWQPDALHLVYGTLIAIAVLTFAWLVSRFTEAKTIAARNWMKGIFGGHP